MSYEQNAYVPLRIMEIKHKLNKINPSMKEPDDFQVINLALAVMSTVCDAHANVELERHEIIEDMINNKQDFNYYVNDLIEQTTIINDVFNEYFEKHYTIKRNEVK